MHELNLQIPHLDGIWPSTMWYQPREETHQNVNHTQAPLDLKTLNNQ